MLRTFGLEVEGLLTNEQGKIVDTANVLLERTQQHSFHGTLVPEGATDMIELNSSVSTTLEDMAGKLAEDMLRTLAVAESIDCNVLFASAIEPRTHPARGGKPRYELNPFVFGAGVPLIGKERVDAYCSCSGMHLHIGREPEREVEQYNLMTALDPSFVLTDSCRFIRSVAQGSVGRTRLIREDIFGAVPSVFGQLQLYIGSLEDITTRQTRALELIRVFVDNDSRLEDAYPLDRTSWGPLRLRENTLEARNADANLYSLLLANFALYKGMMQYAFDQGREVVVGNGDMFESTQSTLFLPSFENIHHVEDCAIEEGLESEYVCRYLRKMLTMAASGLSLTEQQYLTPYFTMVEQRRTLGSTVLEGYTHPYLSPEEATRVQALLSDLFRADIEDPHFLTGIITREEIAQPVARQPTTYVVLPSSAPSPMPRSPLRAA